MKGGGRDWNMGYVLEGHLSCGFWGRYYCREEVLSVSFALPLALSNIERHLPMFGSRAQMPLPHDQGHLWYSEPCKFSNWDLYVRRKPAHSVSHASLYWKCKLVMASLRSNSSLREKKLAQTRRLRYIVDVWAARLKPSHDTHACFLDII